MVGSYLRLFTFDSDKIVDWKVGDIGGRCLQSSGSEEDDKVIEFKLF